MEQKVDGYKNLPRWFQLVIPIINMILATIAAAYINNLFDQESLGFVQWMRIVIFSIMIMLFLGSTIIYLFHKELSWKWFVSGVTLLPILLMLQFVVLLIKVIKTFITSIFQGSLPKPLQQFIENYPSKFDVIILSRVNGQ